MKNHFYFLLPGIFLFLLFGCSKDNDDENEIGVYENGKIEFSYSSVNSTVSDTTLVFTSSGFNLSQLDDYGYFQPSIGWCLMMRHNPDNFNNRAIIFFSGTNLNDLTYPHTFSPGDINSNAQINYVVDSEIITDDTGQQFSVDDTYAATTHTDSFELTILSKVNNRLKGTFQGEIQNPEGDILYVENGVFDIIIVEK